MALDRFIYWNSQKPTFDEILNTARCYIGELGKVEVLSGVIFISLGSSSTTFMPDAVTREERWIEVHWNPKHVDVLTRNQDEFTNDLAASFARRLAAHWNGNLDKEMLANVSGAKPV